MPEKSGFFDHTEDDPREYPAREWAEYFGTLITNGVLNGGLNLNVSATGTDANVSISTGIAWIKGYRYSIYDSPLVLPIQPATTQDRIDRIVLRLDTSIAVKRIRALIVQGTPSANPTAPSIVRSGDVFDLSLAQVRVKANSTIVLPANITDERLNQSVCGLMNSLIKVDTATFQQQWDAFIASVQNQGFATPSYVNAKALEAETNAKDASLPKTGGTVTGALRVNGELTFADGSTFTQLKQSGINAKQGLVDAINSKGGSASTSDSWDTLNAKVRAISTTMKYTKIMNINLESPASTSNIYTTPALGFTPKLIEVNMSFNTYFGSTFTAVNCILTADKLSGVVEYRRGNSGAAYGYFSNVTFNANTVSFGVLAVNTDLSGTHATTIRSVCIYGD